MSIFLDEMTIPATVALYAKHKIAPGCQGFFGTPPDGTDTVVCGCPLAVKLYDRIGGRAIGMDANAIIKNVEMMYGYVNDEIHALMRGYDGKRAGITQGSELADNCFRRGRELSAALNPYTIDGPDSYILDCTQEEYD